MSAASACEGSGAAGAALAHAGRLLYGEHFPAPLAASLSVNLRTVQRWQAGTMAVPAGVWRELAGLLRSHARRCDAAARKSILRAADEANVAAGCPIPENGTTLSGGPLRGF